MPTTAQRPMKVTGTSIGKKYLMAASSLVLFGYVILHLIGNLKVFMGPEPFNHYAEWLRVVGSPMLPDKGLLWIVRVLLIAALIIHVVAYLQLWARTRRARRSGGGGSGSRYRVYDPQVFSWTSRTMAWGGIAILAFVLFHILHLTTGTVHSDFLVGDPYANVLADFDNLWVTLIYMVGVIALGLHLYHGLWSATQTFGLNNPRYNGYRRPTALGISVLITIGYLSIPLAVLTGMLS